jgi:hypothetical protein
MMAIVLPRGTFLCRCPFSIRQNVPIRSCPIDALNDDETAVVMAGCYVFGDEAGLKVSSIKRA